MVPSSEVWLPRPQSSTSSHGFLGWFAAVLTVKPVTHPVLEEMLQQFPEWHLTTENTEAPLSGSFLGGWQSFAATNGHQVDKKEALRTQVVAALA